MTFKGFRQKLEKALVKGPDAVRGLVLEVLDGLPGWGYTPDDGAKCWKDECYLGTFWAPNGEPYHLEAHGKGDGVLVPASVPEYALWDWVAVILEEHGWDSLKADHDARGFPLEDALALTRHFAYGNENAVYDIINKVIPRTLN